MYLRPDKAAFEGRVSHRTTNIIKPEVEGAIDFDDDREKGWREGGRGEGRLKESQVSDRRRKREGGREGGKGKREGEGAEEEEVRTRKGGRPGGREYEKVEFKDALVVELAPVVSGNNV